MRTFLYLLPYILSALICFAVSLIAWRRSSVAGSRAFAVVAFSETIWTGGLIIQFLSPSLSDKLFWNNIQFIGAVVVPLAYLEFAVDYYRLPITRKINSTWKYLIPLAVILLASAWSDVLHNSFRGPASLIPGDPFDRLVFSTGLWFFVYTVYAFSLTILASLLFLTRYLQSGSLYRSQVGIVLVGASLPLGANLLSFFAIISIPIHEIIPLVFGASNLIIAWALYRYHLFELAPVARDFLFEHMPEGILALDQSGRILDLNPTAECILASKKSAVLGRSISDFPPFETSWFNRGSGRREIALQQGGLATLYEIQSSLIGEPTSGSAVHLVILRDIQDRKRAESQLQHLAITDSLTGVHNRRQVLFLATCELARACETHLPLSLILLDVDHFKSVNDTTGHQAGDRTLEGLTYLISEDLGKQDIFGRYGGDEFLIVLPETNLEAALRVAERLRKRTEKFSVPARSAPVCVTISMGVTTAQPGRPCDLDTLLEQADKALYQAKSAGRNQVVGFL
ncbi:MAG: diguanylate cyclase [Anaerolineaceae bacterium]|nr:diguanylate cyclase [Anaerolineaceae bacterium]